MASTDDPMIQKVVQHLFDLLDLYTPIHRSHDPMRRPDPNCPLCIIQRRHEVPPSEEDAMLLNAGALS